MCVVQCHTVCVFNITKNVPATIARGFFTRKAGGRGQATLLLARRAPTMERWSLDARSEGWFACPYGEVEGSERPRSTAAVESTGVLFQGREAGALRGIN